MTVPHSTLLMSRIERDSSARAVIIHNVYLPVPVSKGDEGYFSASTFAKSIRKCQHTISGAPSMSKSPAAPPGLCGRLHRLISSENSRIRR